MRVLPSAQPNAAAALAAMPRGANVDEVRRQVRQLLEQSPAFRALPADKQRDIAYHTVQVCNYLAAPEGIPGPQLAAAQAAADARTGSPSRRLARAAAGDGTATPPRFEAQAAMQGAAATGAYLQAVNFPSFVSQLIEGVFHSIVQASIEQMEAYGKLVQSVAMTLNQFRDENTTDNMGRDHLVEQFPDLFQIDIDTGEEGEQPRVRLRDGVDEDRALSRVNQLPIDGGKIDSLDDDTIEERLVPAARTQLATSRQQLLATMVLMGINRIIVTDGRIAAKVMFDFQARDNFKWQNSATRFDYGDQYKTTSEGEYDSGSEGSTYTYSKSKDGAKDYDYKGASYYAKGQYRNTAEPVLKLASATQAATEAALQSKAQLAGSVEVNFKSETFPLERLADSFQIGRIQDAARPGTAKGAPVGAAGSGGTQTGTTPPGTGATAPGQP